MIVKLNDSAKDAIESILSRGNTCIVYHNKNGTVVLEQYKPKTIYRPTPKKE